MGFGFRLSAASAGPVPAGMTDPPVISIASGSGYVGSGYAVAAGGTGRWQSWTAGAWADLGATALSWTMTAQHEGAPIRWLRSDGAASNVIRMWTPAALGSALKCFWLDPNTGVTVSGASVISVADRFSGLMFSQLAAAQQPVLGTDDGLYLGCALSSLICETAINAGHTFAVARFGAGTETSWGYNYPSLLGARSQNQKRWRGASSTSGNLQNVTVYQNGSSTGATTALPMPKRVTRATPYKVDDGAILWGIGAGTTSTGSQDWTGRVYEMVCLAIDSPDAATIALIEGYLAHRHGLAGALPAGHLYKNSAPRA